MSHLTVLAGKALVSVHRRALEGQLCLPLPPRDRSLRNSLFTKGDAVKIMTDTEILCCLRRGSPTAPEAGTGQGTGRRFIAPRLGAPVLL